MTFDELTPEQKLQVKQDYLVRLADKGRLVEFLFGEGYEVERGPTWEELEDADNLVPDDLMREEGVDYVAEDFGPEGYDVRECDKIMRLAMKNVCYVRFMEDHPGFVPDDATSSAILMAIEWARDAFERTCLAIRGDD